MIHRWPERRPDRPHAVDLNAVFDRGPKPQRSPGRLRRRLIPWLLVPWCWCLLAVDWIWLRFVMIGAKPLEPLDGITPAKAAPLTSGYQPGPRIERVSDDLELVTGMVYTVHADGTYTVNARGVIRKVSPHV